MSFKIKPNFFLIILFLIVGSGLIRLIDFDSFTVSQPALAAVYLIALILAVFFMIRKSKVDKE